MATRALTAVLDFFSRFSSSSSSRSSSRDHDNPDHDNVNDTTTSSTTTTSNNQLVLASPYTIHLSLLRWLRAPLAIMRPEDLKELLLNGISFISERLLHSDDTPKKTKDDASAIIRVDRIKSPSSCFSSSPDHLLSPSPLSEDYELTWRDNGRDYISNAGFESIASLLRAWKDDLESGNVARCPYPDPIVRRFDETSNRKETRLSAVVHNFMLERSSENTQRAWNDAVAGLARVIDATEQWISDFYSPDVFDTIKQSGTIPDLDSPVQKLYDGCCGLCAVGDFLAFAILETHQWGHPGMRSSQLALMQLLVDLEAFHRQQPILSFVVVEKQTRPPGYLYDENGAVEAVTADELRSLWLYGTYTAKATAKSSAKSTLKSICRYERSHASRHERVSTAAASSIKSSRPTHSLLFEKYRKASDQSGLFRRSALRDYKLPAKRKAPPATQDRVKRSRVDKEEKEKEKEKKRSENAAAQAARVPLPPSPAATESDEEDAPVKSQTQTQTQRLSALTDDSSDSDAPRLRISAAKAEERRQLAEHKRATEEAARRKLEEERRKKEEEKRRKEEEELRKKSGLRAPSRKVICALSDSWQARVRAAVRGPDKDIAKSPEGTALRSKDFLTVVPKSEWLNDEIVNGFLLHLANFVNTRAGITSKTQTPRCHAFTSFFWKPLSTRGAAGTERWMKRVGVRADNFLDIDTVLIPICESSHWTLVVVRPTRGTVTHMDSLGVRGGGRRAVTDVVMKWVRDVLKERFDDKHWRVQHVDSPRQTNGWDCGVHTVTNALYLSLGLDPAGYGSKEMPLQRDRIAAMLINGGFSGDFDLGGV